MKEEVEALLQGQGAGQELEDVPMDGFVRGTARYMLQVAIEAEATAFLGRGHYRRGDRTRVGWRNGYEPKAVQTEAGLLKFAVPQLRATANRSARRCRNGWPPARRIWRRWCAGCMCAGCRPKTSARCMARRSAKRA